MTIEQEFFEAFGIEPINYIVKIDLNKMIALEDSQPNKYPPITSDIVLGLEEIVMLMNDDYNFSVEHIADESRFLFCSKRVILENENNLKDCILSSCIQLKDEIQDQVQQLFKGDF